MFTEILIIISKLAFLVVIFLVAFGLGFHILLSEKVINIFKPAAVLNFLKSNYKFTFNI